MNVKDVIEVEIVSSGMDGEGIARVDGKVVFIPYTLKGERVRAVVKTVKKNFCTASVIKVLYPSEHRRTPECPHYYKCGGCDTMHLDDGYRTQMLKDELENNLAKIANIAAPDIRFVESETPHRNKIAMPFGVKDGKIILGMYAQNSHSLVPVGGCILPDALAASVIFAVAEFVNERKLSVYNESTGNGLLRHLVVRRAGERAQVTLVVNGERFEGENELYGRLPSRCDLFVSPNTRKNNVILGDSVRLVGGNDRLPVEVLGVKTELSPLSFFQVNDFMRDKLYADALAHVDGDKLIDLYSGIGITSNLAARKGARVTAVECVPQAVADADRTAEINGNENSITNICGEVRDVLPRIARGNENADVLVDPPRKGCGSEVMRAIAELSPRKLVYISCNHATMCRDIRAFLDAADGYELCDIGLYDMFCNTHHVETLLCLKRK